MGYTHYWEFKKPKEIKSSELEKTYQKTIIECQKILNIYNKQCESWERLSGYAAHCKPGQYGGININGKGDEGHENFILREHFNQNDGFTFCKTAQKPYDLAVIACLATLKYRLKDAIEVSSDGCHEDWIDGVELARNVLKRKIPNPIPKAFNSLKIA